MKSIMLAMSTLLFATLAQAQVAETSVTMTGEIQSTCTIANSYSNDTAAVASALSTGVAIDIPVTIECNVGGLELKIYPENGSFNNAAANSSVQYSISQMGLGSDSSSQSVFGPGAVSLGQINSGTSNGSVSILPAASTDLRTGSYTETLVIKIEGN